MKYKENRISIVLSVGIVLMMLIPAGMMVQGAAEPMNTNAQPPSPVGYSAGGGDEVNTIVTQLDSNTGKDTWIYEYRPKENYGGDTGMYVGNYSGHPSNALIQVPIPQTRGEIMEAHLSLYAINENVPLDNVSAYMVTSPWTEGTGIYSSNPSPDDSNWNNRTTGTPWNTAGGDYDATLLSHFNCSMDGAWYTLNVTEAVKAWSNGSSPNYGIILTSDVDAYLLFATRENSNPEIRPKLTITCGTEISPQVPPIGTEMNVPVDVDLSGMGYGTVAHASPANTNPNSIPFFGQPWNACHYQAIYPSDEVGAEGKIMRIAFDRAGINSANFSNVVIKMAHTNRTDLTNTFDDNYNGFLIEVFNQSEVLLNSSDSDPWIYFDLNGNFTYDSSHNLLMDITWKGDGGNSTTLLSRDTGHQSRLYSSNISSSTGSTSTTHVLVKFYVDAEKNAAYDAGGSAGWFAFTPGFTSSLRAQYLYNSSFLNNEAGFISELAFQTDIVGTAVMENFSIRMAHSNVSDLDSVFENNHEEPWTEVINRTSYTMSNSGGMNWIHIKLDHPFYYNGSAKLLVEIRYNGGHGDNLWATGTYVGYTARCINKSDSSATSGSTSTPLINMEVGFMNSPDLTWSAASSDTGLFTVNIDSSNVMHIIPVGNAHGKGMVHLTLHNGPYSTTQDIPVYIRSTVEINPLVSDISTDEDTPVNVDLSGRASGTVVQVSGAQDTSNLWPFYTHYQQGRYQALYYPYEVGAEGVITRIAINRSEMASTTVSDLRIYMAHTDLSGLTATFDNNYNGYLTEVFHVQDYVLGSSNTDSWLYFDLNWNFTYDSAHNLLVEIRWNGTGGVNVPTWNTNAANTRRAYAWDNNANTALGTGSLLPVTKFYVDAEKNAAYDAGGSAGWLAFTPHSVSSLRAQYLYNSSFLNHESGYISELAFQTDIVGTAVMENFSIRMAHANVSDLNSVFENNHEEPWTEVINRSSYTMSNGGGMNWMYINLDHPFYYNGSAKLLVEIRYNGGHGDNLWVTGKFVGYTSRCIATNSAANSGSTSTALINMEVGFMNSPDLTWSAASSDTGLFTVNIDSSNVMHINPVADAYGGGVLNLTLSTGTYSITQSIAVNINSVNDPPVISGFPSTISCTEDVPHTIDAAPYISDVETDDANLTITTSSQYATVNGTNITFLYPEGITSENVTITVTDEGGLSNSTWTNVSITPVNDPPYLENFVDNITVDATVPYDYILYPMDEETPDNITVVVGSPYGEVNGTTITFTYPKGHGSAYVAGISLTDGEIYGTANTVYYTLYVTVIEHPEVLNVSVSGYSVTVSFDMPMNTSTVEINIGSIQGNITWNSDGTEATFTSNTAVSGNYTLTIPESAENTDGISMLSAYSTSITFEYTGADTDGDGMPDNWEGDNGLNPNDASDGAQDNDNDGLSNQQEYNEGTNPNSNDTDNDGMPDNWEVNNGTNPTVNDADNDDDNDGLTNIQEYQDGTDPQDSDTDGDGIPDGNDSNPLIANPSSSGIAGIPLWMILVAVIAIAGIAIAALLKKKGGRGPEPESPDEGYIPPQEGMQQALEGQEVREFGEQPSAEQTEPTPEPPSEEGMDIGEDISGEF